MKRYRNILLIQLGDIGDVIMTTPAIRAIKETYPESRVSILVHKPSGSLLSADPNLHEVVEFAGKSNFSLQSLRDSVRFAGRLYRARYDLVIDLRVGDRGTFFSFLTGAPKRIAYKAGQKRYWHKLLLTDIIENPPESTHPVHPGANQSLCILRTIGIDTDNSNPRLHLTAHAQKSARALLQGCGLTYGGKWFTLNPYSRWKYKEWSNEKWAQVINSLWVTFCIPSVLVGSAEESSAAADIVKSCEGYAYNLAGKTNLGELAAIISMSSLHLGVDSAAPHIAAALGTPAVTIHGPSDWRAWRVNNDMNKIITPSMDCVPCNRKGCDDTEVSQCLNQLKAETVVEVVKSLLWKILDRKISE